MYTGSGERFCLRCTVIDDPAMRILEINKFFYLRRGAERHLFDVETLLRERGHEVEAFAMAHPENKPARFEKYFPRFVGYHRGEATLWQRVIGVGRLFWSFEASRGMRALLVEWQPDIAHLHNIYHQLSPAILKPLRERGIPLVMTVHDYNLISPDKDAYYPAVGRQYYQFLFIKKYSFTKRLLLVLRMYWQAWFRFYERAIALYIVPSDFVKQVFLAAGMPEAKLVVVPHFISEERLAPVTDQAISQLDLPVGPFAFYAGSLSRAKGTDVLAALFERLEIPLVLAGQIEPGCTLNRHKFVRCIGQQPKNVVEYCLGRSACVVSASPLPETFGLIALEANAAGKPFFGLAVGALPEIIISGKTGMLVGDPSQLREVVSQFFQGKITFSAEAMRTSVHERFSAAHYGKTVEALFSRCLQDLSKSG